MPALSFPLSGPLGGDPVENTASTTRMLQLLLPPGLLWNLEPDSWLYKTLDAFAAELVYVIQRGANVISESLPNTANETLPDWATLLGLPDDAVPAFVSLTPAQQQIALTQKYVGRGGQTPVFFQALVEACGYTSVTVTDGFSSEVCLAGRARAGDRCYGGDWAFTWQIQCHAGANALPTANLEAVINRAKPSHTAVGFTFI